MSKIFFSYYMINRRVRDLSFHHYLGYFSRKCSHARITPPLPPLKISFFLALSPHRTLTTLLILEACSLLVTNLYHISQPRMFQKNNCSSEIIALLSDKLAKIFFRYSVTLNKFVVFTDIEECHDDSHGCDYNVNCTNTNASYNCICKKGYIITGQSC